MDGGEERGGRMSRPAMENRTLKAEKRSLIAYPSLMRLEKLAKSLRDE